MKYIYCILIFGSMIFASCEQDLTYELLEEQTPLSSTIIIPPDISPEHQVGTVSYLPNSTKEVAVRIRNFGGETSGPVSFYIQKIDPVLTVSFDTTATSYTIGPNVVLLDNVDWTVVEQGVRWKFTTKPGVTIDMNAQSVVGLKLTAFGGVGNVTFQSTVLTGTGGGETPSTNNIKITRINVGP